MESRDARPTVILLNGPPGVGKDTLGDVIQRLSLVPVTIMSFKKRLIEIALLVSGISKDEWELRYNDRALKEAPWGKLGGMSQREYLIRISEDWVKPIHGRAYFGEAASIEAGKATSDVLFTDSGFPLEVYPFIDRGFDVYIFRLYRKGFSFQGDSRNYVRGIEGAKEFDIILEEDQSLEAGTQILDILESYW